MANYYIRLWVGGRAKVMFTAMIEHTWGRVRVRVRVRVIDWLRLGYVSWLCIRLQVKLGK